MPDITNKEKIKRFKDRFAVNSDTGVRKLTSYGCMQKYNIPREEVYLTNEENKTRNFERSNRVEAEERHLVIEAQYYFSMGYKLLDNESFDDFIARCRTDEEVSCIHDCDNCRSRIC